MSKSRIALFVLLPLLGLATLFLLQRAQRQPIQVKQWPLPTEHRLDSEAERLNRKGRKLWIEEMHFAAPGTDWRAIERRNGLMLQDLRNAREGVDWQWTEIGSRNQAGRMHASALSTAGDSLYGSASGGGIWKGSLHGEGWRPLADNLYGGSHDLAVAGTAPEVVTTIRSNGFIRYSDDEGLTWQLPAGLPANISSCIRVERDVASSDRVYLLLIASGVWLHLYISEDAGRSYDVARDFEHNIVGDFWLDRVDGNDLYVVDYKTIFFSDDQGQTWQERGQTSTIIPGEAILTGSEAGAPTLYVANNGGGGWKLYRSDDGGYNWEWRYDITDFWETLCASIDSPNTIIFAGVECWRSPNGGLNFFKVNNWWDYYNDPVNKLHADFPGMHCINIPGEGSAFFPASDGGLYRSDDNMASVTNISLTGLGVSQYYDIHTSVNDPNLLLAGSQDQGYQRSTGPSGPGTWDFDQLISGDYGHLTSSDGSHDLVFSVYPGFTLLQEGELNPVLHSLDFPSGENHSWMPFILADPDDPEAYYFCGTHLQRGQWLGGDLVSYTASAQDFTVAGGSYTTALSIAPSDHDRRITVTNNGKIWYSADGGSNWTLSDDDGPSAHYFYGTAIAHSGSDPLRAYLGGSGYSGPGVYRTDDGGVTWTPMSFGLPSTLVYGLALENPTSQALYAATEAGPYRYDPDAEEWSYIGATRAPLTTYWCVDAVPAIGTVRFGTYGRGIWEYEVGDGTAVAEEDQPAAADFALANFPNPFNPQTTLRYRLAEAGAVRLTLYDASGRLVTILEEGRRDAGTHEHIWNGKDGQGRDCPSGIYLANIQSGESSESHRLTLVR